MLRSQKPSFPMTLFGVAVMIAAIFVVLFSGASGITPSNIESHLQRFAEFAAQQATASGRQASFTHGDVRIEGMGYAKRGVINGMTLEVKEGDAKWTLTIPAVRVQPDPTSPKRLFFVFADPIQVVRNDQPHTTVTFTSPLKYSYFNGYNGRVATVLHSLYLPDSITLAAPGASTPHTTITYDRRPMTEARFLPDLREREFIYAFRNLKVVTEGSETAVASLASDFKETQDEQGKVSGRYTLMANDLAIKSGAYVSKPYSLNADLNYSGDIPWLSTATPGLGNTQVTVNQVALMGSDFKIISSGNVALAADDPLPSGQLEIIMQNVGRFLESDLVPGSLRPVAADALQKVTGQSAEAATNTKFVLRREKNGVFYVGNTTFEALTAAVLSNMLDLPDLAPSAPSEAPPVEPVPPSIETPPET